MSTVRSRHVRSEILYSLRFLGVGLLLCAALFVGSGPLYLARTQSAERWLAQLTALPDSPGQPGARIAIEGHIAHDATALFRRFVAYVYETHRSARSPSSWWVQESEQKSAFEIDTRHGRLRLGSADYAFTPWLDSWPAGRSTWSDSLVADWDHTDKREGATPGSTADKVRYRGFVAGGPVVVIGRQTADSVIDAEYVIGGTRSELRAKLSRMAAGDGDPTGYWFMVAAMVVAGVLTLAWIAFAAWLIRSVNRLTLVS